MQVEIPPGGQQWQLNSWIEAPLIIFPLLPFSCFNMNDLCGGEKERRRFGSRTTSKFKVKVTGNRGRSGAGAAAAAEI